MTNLQSKYGHASRPACDICRLRSVTPRPAVFDAAVPGSRHWAYMCGEHFTELGCKLGTGVGTRL